MAIIETNLVTNDSIVFYQEWADNGDPAEAAIIITPYSDSIALSQESRQVNISSHEFDAFCKLLNRINKERKAK